MREVQKCWSAGASREQADVETWTKTGGCSYVVLKNTGWSKLAREGIIGRLLRQQGKMDMQERQGFLGSLGNVYC
jgi:hypothetical protein